VGIDWLIHRVEIKGVENLSRKGGESDHGSAEYADLVVLAELRVRTLSPAYVMTIIRVLIAAMRASIGAGI
jgi:hypothetical protein